MRKRNFIIKQLRLTCFDQIPLQIEDQLCAALHCALLRRLARKRELQIVVSPELHAVNLNSFGLYARAQRIQIDTDPHGGWILVARYSKKEKHSVFFFFFHKETREHVA